MKFLLIVFYLVIAITSCFAQGEESIACLEKEAEFNPSAGNYRLLAEAYERTGNYPKAVEAYRKEASIYREKGDINAAIVEETKANTLDVEFTLYYTEHVNKEENISTAKGEPERGCYIGAYIENDRRIGGNFEKFNKYAGKNHSSFYAYLKYGEPFPYTWCNEIKKLGAIPHIAWEPENLSGVKDDEYLQKFAGEAGKLAWPVFLRFASEMNGDWTPYTGNPSLYKEKFRLVHDIFEKRASKVMMLWTPNSIPQSNIQDYYPGDEYVDWVGVNIYSVHHHGKDLSWSGEKEDPTYLLEYVYNLYSSRKPIHVSEFASTHFCKACGKEVKGFGISRLYQMYGSVMTKFPRVKCIDWFDCDSIHETGYEVSSPNDYSLTDDLDVLNVYREVVNIDYFLGKLNPDGTPVLPDYKFSPLNEGTNISGQSIVCSFVRSYLKKPQITYYIDGVKTQSTGPPFYLQVSSGTLTPGLHVMRADLEGDNKGVIATREVNIFIEEGNTVISIPEVEPVREELSLEPEGSKYLWQEKWGGRSFDTEISYDTVPTPVINTEPVPIISTVPVYAVPTINSIKSEVSANNHSDVKNFNEISGGWGDCLCFSPFLILIPIGVYLMKKIKERDELYGYEKNIW